MTWVRGSDKAGSHPRLMDVATLPDADERSINEVMGFVFRLATLTSCHRSGYTVPMGTVHMVGGPRWAELLDQALAVGLVQRAKAEGRAAVRLSTMDRFLYLRATPPKRSEL